MKIARILEAGASRTNQSVEARMLMNCLCSQHKLALEFKNSSPLCLHDSCSPSTPGRMGFP
jgi:hypothetical protein